MNKKRIIYWSLTGLLIGAGLFLSVVDHGGGHYAFEWRGSELLAQQKADEYHDLASLQVLNRVLIQLQQNYVDNSRLDPNQMLAFSLDNLQKNLPELLLIFDKKVKEHPTQVEVSIQGQKRTFSLEKLDNLWEMSLRLRTIVTFIQDYLPKDAKPQELEYALINGMLASLDPHSLILSPELYQSMMDSNRGKFGGLGIVVRMVDGVLIVVEPITDDVPAKRAGMKEGDQIISIDGTPTLNMNISEAVELLKGDPDTTVHLTVMRKGWKKPKPIDVVRAEINIPSIESTALKDKIAYIKLKNFQGNSQTDMLKALENLSKEMGGLEGLILDLRGNPGGLLDQAVFIADDFLSSGTIVTTVGANELLQKPRVATAENTQSSYPIIVLMDSSSASASEIVAGALKNNNRALIVGDTSFGKGSVQVLYELPDKSALKLTIGQYLTPGDQSIQSVGIVPDIRLVPMLASTDGFDLYPKPWVRREETLGSHLDNENATRDLKPSYNLRYLSQRYALSEEEMDDDSIITLEDIDKLIKTKEKANKPGDDPQVRLASQILKKIGGHTDRPEMLKAFSSSAEQIQLEEEKALVDQLAKLGIDWSKGNQPQNISLKLELTTDNPENSYKAGDEYTIHAKVTNTGSEPVFRIAGRSESSFSRINDKELIFGKIEPGQTITRDYAVKTNRALSSRDDSFKLKLYADDGTPIPETAIAQNEIFIDNKGNTPGNSLLDDDETVTMRVWVSNRGQGIAEEPLIYLKNKAPEVKLIDARSETESLENGQILSRDFTFKTQKVGQKDIAMELHVYDKSSTHMLVENIAFKTSKNSDISDSNPVKVSEIKTVSKPTKLFVSPIDKANSLTSIPENTIVQTDATLGNYTHITAGPVSGWVESTSLEPTTEKTITALDVETIATIPRISLNPMSHITENGSIRIQADIASWAELKDYYIYTATEVDHNILFEKVAYTQLSNDNHRIDAKIPLQPGLNSIRIYVRDMNNSEAHETVLVYRIK